MAWFPYFSGGFAAVFSDSVSNLIAALFVKGALRKLMNTLFCYQWFGVSKGCRAGWPIRNQSY
jgi:hypothetical protein